MEKIDVRDKQVHGVQLSSGEYIPCSYVISNLIPHVVFDRMVDHSEIPERDLKAMNARKMAQAAFTVYLGLDASAEESGISPERSWDMMAQRLQAMRLADTVCGKR